MMMYLWLLDGFHGSADQFLSGFFIASFMFFLSCPFCVDFEDMSCEMVYGQVPPPFEEDPVSKQPCFADICKFLKKSTDY